MLLSQRLQTIIAEYDLLKHPMYQAWTAGELSLDVLKRYAAQYYAYVAYFPRFISRVHAECPEIAARKVLLENLVDEEIHGKDHPALWMQFAKGLGLTRAAVLQERLLPETKAMIEDYCDLAAGDWRDGLCALYAYESQVPAVSASKIAGLKKFYGMTDEEALAFFTAHQIYDVEHSAQVAKLVDEYADPMSAEKAVRRASSALWKFLDGMQAVCV